MHDRRIRGEAGYSLVVLIFLVGTLGVMAASALPSLKMKVQREKEAELIFRGLQYAEGIRVFQQRFGRYPNTLDELIKLEPRSIRQLWKDPMVEDGAWGLVYAGGSGQRGSGEGQSEGGAQQGASDEGRDLGGGAAPESLFNRGRNQQPRVGPILGVVSRKKGSAARTFMDKDNYSEWRFTANILPKPRVIPGTDMVVGGSVESLGKGFPLGLKPQGGPTDGTENLTEAEGLTDRFDEDEGDN